MADPKAAKDKEEKRRRLNINAAEKDVFESVEAEKKEVEEEEEEIGGDTDRPEIDRHKLKSTKHAQRVFMNAELDPNKREPASTTRYHSPVTLFLDGQQDFEAVPRGAAPETPLQRYQRLRAEVQQLSDEIEASAKVDGKKIEQGVAATQLHEHVRELSSQLGALAADERVAPLLDPAYPVRRSLDTQGRLTQRLIEQVRALGAASDGRPATAAPPAAAGAGAGGMVYELYYAPENAKLTELAKVGELERRLADLERLCGTGPGDTERERAESLLKETGSPDLQTAVAGLDKKLTLLDEDKLRPLQRRLVAVTKTLDELLRKKAEVPASEGFEKRVDEVFEKVDRWDSVAVALPSVIERLQALRTLHEEAANFSVTLRTLDAAQTELAAGLKAQSTLLGKVQESFGQNSATIERNFKTVEERISKLTADMAALK